MTGPSVEVIDSAGGIPGQLRVDVLGLDDAALVVDGVAALDDQVRLDLSGRPDSVRHLVARWPGSGEVVGYGHVDLRGSDAVSAHLLVGPAERRQGIGTALLGRVIGAAARSPVGVWAHGDTAAGGAFARRHGFESVREIRQMRRRLQPPLPQPSYDPGVSVRPFVPGADDEAWVAVNAASFNAHPEQGRLTVDDLRQRMAQPWFDPTGFFLAERGGHLLGYHWTKVHRSGGADGEPIGEVYVLGVHPDAQGLGLGRSLTLTGLHHLRERGLTEVMLYVDGDNLAAVSMYERLGFAVFSVDVVYARTL